nr:uncharacterized protein LOC109771591 [Aegilops tauschii subsp. strangulata]
MHVGARGGGQRLACMLRLLGAPPLRLSPQRRILAPPADDDPPAPDGPASAVQAPASRGRSSVALVELDEPGDRVAVLPPERRRSARIARNEPSTWLGVEEKAMRLRALRDALTGCSPRLKSKVARAKMLDGVLDPLTAAATAAVRSAAAIPSAPAQASSDGLGGVDKCGVVRNAIHTVNPVLACIQESKLSDLSTSKARSFLPSRLGSFVSKNAEGSRGGMVTAWDPNVLSLSASSASRYTLTASLSSTRCALSFRITNVYAPSDHAFTADFVEDLMSVAAGITGPWLVLGDFNLIRFPHEKNNDRFDASRAAVFNSLVNSLALHELALSDRLFTWTNRRDPPTLARLDRVFFDHAWDVAFPDSGLSSRPRSTSDHVPLVVEAATRIPSPSRFFFENAWLRDPQFLPSTLSSWSNTGASRCAVGCLATRKKRFRAAAKVWKRLHKYIPAFDNNCKFVIDLLDFWEECRTLSSDEHQLRQDTRVALAASIRRQSAYWKQRGKCRAVCEGDENTGFFHASASHRRRANSIRVLDVDGAMVLDHAGKAAALLTFYSDLLGRARPAVWSFDLEALYRHALRVDAAALVAPFLPSEIKDAANLLDRTSAPGPDGLGPAFYQAAWSTVAGDLQLQKQIGGIIDVDQSGFLAGRSISENFVYAAEVIQCCHKRGAPALVFKLDFTKAFDSVNWGALRRILMARGFPCRWCDWMDLIFESSRSAVLLNGVPGRWFTVRRGLRQGDPCSPYLFLIVADVLQQMICQDGALFHPLIDGKPPW